jgi:hypothetical protein
MRFPIFAVLLVTPLFAQEGSLRHITFEDQPSVVLSNEELALTILMRGSTLGDLVLQRDSTKLSPLWNPARLARESGEKSGFGFSFGHFVCVDGFGPSSKEEQAAGLEGHGEAHRQMFEVVSSGKEGHDATVTLSAKLPIVQETFTRTFRIVDGESVIYVDSQLENLLGFDRPINWAEHATIGSPFLESGVTVVNISGVRSQTRPYDRPGDGPTVRRLKSGADFRWPNAPALDGKLIDLSIAPLNPHYLDHSTTLLDPARKLEWVTAINPKMGLIIGYVFRREDYPWIQYWGNYPPSQKMSRGMEFGTQPYDLPRREVISTGKMFNTPTYRWLPAKSKIESHFLLFYTRLPEGFHKVDTVELENGQIVIQDRSANKRITLTASRPL